MVNALLANFLRDVPQAAVIWSTLIVLAMTMIVVLAVRPEPKVPSGDSVPEAGPPPEPAPTPEELRRFAEEVTVAANRAAVTAQRRRAEWLWTQEQTQRAWEAWEAADAASRRLAQTVAFPAPRTPRTPAEYAARERYLHRAAMAAYWRRELTVTELSDVFAHRNGWDPRRHPVEQEIVLRSVIRDLALARYRTAAQREREAWREAEMTAVAARSLADESFAAAAQARAALRPLPARRAVLWWVPALSRLPGATIRWRAARVG